MFVVIVFSCSDPCFAITTVYVLLCIVSSRSPQGYSTAMDLISSSWCLRQYAQLASFLSDFFVPSSLKIPESTRCGTSAASHGPSCNQQSQGHYRRTGTRFTPRARACAMPKWGTFLDHSGLKWADKQILPPLRTDAQHQIIQLWILRLSRNFTITNLYILAVLPSNSGNTISNGAVG